MRLPKLLRFLPDIPIWTVGRFGDHVRFAKFRQSANGNLELLEELVCGLMEVESIVARHFLMSQPVAILDQSLIGLVSREPQIPSGTKVEDWIDHTVEDIGYELHVANHASHSRSCIGKWGESFPCISRLENAASLLPRCLDWGRMASEGVVLDVHSHDTDILLYAESKVLAYLRFGLGSGDHGFEQSLQDLLRRWWGELVPMASPSMVYVWTDVWGADQLTVSPAPVLSWMESWKGETRLLSRMAMDEIQKGMDTQEGFGSNHPEEWIRRHRWLTWERKIRKWTVVPLLFLWCIAGVLWLGEQLYSFHYREQIRFAQAQAQANFEVDSLRIAVKNEQDKMEDWLSRKSNLVKSIVSITEKLPARAWVVHWNTQGTTHSLKGYAGTPQEVGQFVENMEKSRQFASVRLRTTEKTKLDGKPVIGFEIEVATR